MHNIRYNFDCTLISEHNKVSILKDGSLYFMEMSNIGMTSPRTLNQSWYRVDKKSINLGAEEYEQIVKKEQAELPKEFRPLSNTEIVEKLKLVDSECYVHTETIEETHGRKFATNEDLTTRAFNMASSYATLIINECQVSNFRFSKEDFKIDVGVDHLEKKITLTVFINPNCIRQSLNVFEISKS